MFYKSHNLAFLRSLTVFQILAFKILRPLKYRSRSSFTVFAVMMVPFDGECQPLKESYLSILRSHFTLTLYILRSHFTLSQFFQILNIKYFQKCCDLENTGQDHNAQHLQTPFDDQRKSTTIRVISEHCSLVVTVLGT